jgi:hypothetical protein
LRLEAEGDHAATRPANHREHGMAVVLACGHDAAFRRGRPCSARAMRQRSPRSPWSVTFLAADAHPPTSRNDLGSAAAVLWQGRSDFFVA